MKRIPAGSTLIMYTMIAPNGWRQHRCFPNNVRDALAGESTRPRVSRLGEGALITLRCINGSTDERPDQLVAMRVYMDGRLIARPDNAKCWRWTMW
ncbi:hypothetical protein ACNKHT_11525 [Shigella flexneri]